MRPLVFISYRRSVLQQAAQGLYLQLRARIGATSVFMDRSAIAAGDRWPQRLSESVDRATVVLALIGPGWLGSADEYGRRRLDIADDWVRKELLAALTNEKAVIPVLLGSLQSMPPAVALPNELRDLSNRQAYGLRDDHWDSDLNELVQLLVEKYNFKETDRKVRLPEPRVDVRALTQAELETELEKLPGWEPVESLIPGDYPRSRQELRKVYVFKSFRAAIEFMNATVDSVSSLQHHPRWENQWRTVTVHITTWDIGFKISRLDVDLAKALNAAYEKLPAAQPDPGGRSKATART